MVDRLCIIRPILLIVIIPILFSCAPTSSYKQGGKEIITEDETNELKCFIYTYKFVQRDHITPPTFLENFENTLKGIQELLGQERLSYSRTSRNVSISSSGEHIEINDVTDEQQRLDQFERMFSFVERTNPQFDLQSVAYAASKGIARVDRHSAFMTPKDYKELQEETRGRFAGIGVELMLKEGVITVVEPTENAPSFKAGILPEDQIIMIDGKPTEGLSLRECIKLLRGPKDTNVTVTIGRQGVTGTREFVIVRDALPSVSVRYKLLEKQYGYIRIPRFQEKTDAEFEKVVKTLAKESKGGLKGIILDLRNNSGGLLDQSIKLADRFIESGLIASTIGRRKERNSKFFAHHEGTLPHYPLVVLTNNLTAAGAEVVVAALQDHKRGIIVGTQTSGHGRIQDIIPLLDGSCLRLTTAIWLTPLGREVEGKGIVPDLVVISKKDKALSSVPSDQPRLVLESNENEATLRIALEILKNTLSNTFQDLMDAVRKINGAEMGQPRFDSQGEK